MASLGTTEAVPGYNTASIQGFSAACELRERSFGKGSCGTDKSVPFQNTYDLSLSQPVQLRIHSGRPLAIAARTASISSSRVAKSRGQSGG